MIIVSSSGNSSNSSSNSTNNKRSRTVAAVVEAITTIRNCSISSSSSSRSCNNSSINSCIFYAFSLKTIVIVMAVIIAIIHLRIFSDWPKTSDHNSNATPFKGLQCFGALSYGRAQVDIKGKWVSRLISHTPLFEETSITSIYNHTQL